MAEEIKDGALRISASIDTSGNSKSAQNFINEVDRMEKSADRLSGSVEEAEKKINALGKTVSFSELSKDLQDLVTRLSSVRDAAGKAFSESAGKSKEERKQLQQAWKDADKDYLMVVEAISQGARTVKEVQLEVNKAITESFEERRIAEKKLEEEQAQQNASKAANLESKSVAELQARYKALIKEKERLFSQADDNFALGNEGKGEEKMKLAGIREDKAAEIKKYLESIGESVNVEPVESLQKQLRALREEISSLTLQYRSLSEEEKNSDFGKEIQQQIEESTKKAGEMKDAIHDVQKAISAELSDTKVFDALGQGIDTVVSGIGTAIGVEGLFAKEQEELIELQTKLQGVLTISNGIKTIQNNLQKESNLMMGIGNIQTAAAAAATKIKTAAEGKGVVVTWAAVAAQKALNFVARQNPYVLLAVAITTVVGAIYAFIKGSKEEEEQLERVREETEALNKAKNDLYDTIASKTADTRSKYEDLRKEWKALSTESEKRKWIKENANEFQTLGLNINDVSSAERVLVSNTDNVVKALELRARAAALQSMQTKAYESYYKTIAGADDSMLGEGIKYIAKMQLNATNDFINSEVENAKNDFKDVAGKDVRWDANGKRSSSGSGKSGSGKTAEQIAAEARVEAEKLAQERKKQARERQRQEEDIASKLEKEAIDRMVEGSNKRIAQMRFDHKQQERELQRQLEDDIEKERSRQKTIFDIEEEEKAKKNDKYAKKTFTDADIDQQGIKNIQEAYERLFESLHKTQVYDEKQLAKERLQVELDYLKEYGSAESKRLALTKEKEAKIAELREGGASAFEIASVEKQFEEAIKSLNVDEIFKKINWENVFSELKSHTKEYLEGLRDELQNLLKSGTLKSVEDIKEVQEKIDSLNAAISDKSGMFGFVGQRAMEHRRLLANRDNAVEALKQAKIDESVAEGILNGMDLMGIKHNTDAYKKAEDDLRKAREKTAKATKDAKDAEDAARRTSLQAVDDWFADAQEFIGKYSIDQIPDFLKSVGLGGAGEKAAFGLSAFNNAAGAAADLASQNYIGAAMKAVSALSDFGNMLGIGGSSDKTLQRDMERLTLSNQNLEKAINSLREEMSEASFSDASDIYKKQIDALQAEIRGTQSIMQRNAKVYDSGSLGLFGGKASANSKINNALSASDWTRISQAAGRSVRNASDFFSLTSKQMDSVRTNATDLYTKIQIYAKKGYGDVLQYMDEYADKWKQLEELEDTYNEKLTSTTFDNVKNDFADKLKTMETTAQDWSNSFEDMMRNAVVNALSSDFNGEIEEWYKNFAKDMESGKKLTAEEMEARRNEYLDIVRKGEEERDAMFEALGLGDSSGTAQATTSSAMSITEDTANDLVGRATAVQIGVERMDSRLALTSEIMQGVGVSVGALAGKIDTQNGYISEIVDLQHQGNSYLYDIVKNTNRLANIETQLIRIKENTETL